MLRADKTEGLELSLLEEGDLVIADASEDFDGVCDCMEVKNIENKKVTAGLHTFAARDASGKTANGFRSYLLKHEAVSKRLKQISTGVSVHGVSKGNLQKVLLFVPPIDEQEAIAEVLSDADQEIEKLEAKLARWKEQKTYLLNELVTGSIRVGAA